MMGVVGVVGVEAAAPVEVTLKAVVVSGQV